MKIKPLIEDFSVCKLDSAPRRVDFGKYYFIGSTDEEYSLVCETCRVPETAFVREDGWKAFRIQGTLEFSLIGILAKISAILAEAGIGIFVVSTFDTDYVLVKTQSFGKALKALEESGYDILWDGDAVNI